MRCPSNPSGIASCGGSNIAVVWTNCLAWIIPGEPDLLASEGQRLGSIVCNGRLAAITSRVSVQAALVLRNIGFGWIGSPVSNSLEICSVIG